MTRLEKQAIVRSAWMVRYDEDFPRLITLQTAQFEAALQSFEQALAIYREIGDRQEEVVILVVLGSVYLQPTRNRSISRMGGAPNIREYSRLNCDVLS